MTFETLLAHRAVQALGQALLHFWWQGSLLALLLWIVKSIAPASARIRYAAAALVLAFAGAPVVARQPAFEVASVKPNVSGDLGPRYNMGPSFAVESATLKDLVKIAYEVEDFRISGGPAWINSDRYNIEARATGTPGSGLKEMEAWRRLQEQRLQTLLQDRFKLALHRETKELPIYDLTVAKGGPKLQPSSCITRDAAQAREPLAPGQKPSDFCGYGGFGRGFYENTTASGAGLAVAFSTLLGRVVVDKTGITGSYHVFLKFVPDDSIAIRMGPPGEPAAPASSVDGPNIFTAVQEQLGLKLESAKGPVEVLVIDHVEKPSEN